MECEIKNKPKSCIDIVLIDGGKDRKLEFIETTNGRIDITPAVDIGEDVPYAIHLFDNGTVDVYKRVAEGEMGVVQ